MENSSDTVYYYHLSGNRQPISIESSKNFTITTRDSNGKVTSRLVLDKDKLECLSKSFQILNGKGSVLFSANDDEIVVGAEVLRVTGDGGAIFDGSVQTPLIKAASGSELKLESPTRSLEMKAPLGVAIESRAGDISASCLTDLKLQSLDGAIRLDSENVYFSKLRKGFHTIFINFALAKTEDCSLHRLMDFVQQKTTRYVGEN
ncbi:delta-sarcoglycan, putative [Pediculus humanus corporis]|uniref:Delta-sarcoglycan, putative n=1 Tax=Pediculus humanus subsp. corporis TaxID=121224 RepID=E0VX55_PEDHC|nr:delta-sarcoglycan, putative [Pediculus humanus corporis]EEB17961.1 delta-sarcoglycan, putative [Pediculus humanus corporis]